MLDLAALNQYAEKCSHCKFCHAACPVFGETLVETLSPRARVNLVKACLVDKTLEPGDRFDEIIDSCLLCSSCQRTCPAAIPVDRIVAAARGALPGRNGGLSAFFKKRFMQSRGEDRLFEVAARLGKRSGYLSADVPVPAREPFRPVSAEKLDNPRATVAYFVGCATNVFYPDTARDLIEVYTRNNIRVVIPPGLSCCGLPAVVEGDFVLAKKHMEVNLKALAAIECDAVVTDCTSCAAMMREWTPELFGPAGHLAEEAARNAAKTFESVEYLARIGLESGPLQYESSVTYHVPCHQGPSPNLVQAPRELLAMVEGLELREMEFPERCCGGGGDYYIRHSQTSASIREKKISDIRATGANIVVTQCPSCRSYLAVALEDMEVIHPLTVLARAMTK